MEPNSSPLPGATSANLELPEALRPKAMAFEKKLGPQLDAEHRQNLGQLRFLFSEVSHNLGSLSERALYLERTSMCFMRA